MAEHKSHHFIPADDDELTANEEQANMTITVHHHGSAHPISIDPSSSTLQDLSSQLASILSVPVENQKLLITPKPGLQKPPFPATPISSLPLSSPRFKITLLGSTSSEISNLNNSVSSSRQRQHRAYPVKPAKPTSTTSTTSSSNITSSPSTQYTFHKLLPLSYLPHPDRSLTYLHRLRDDRGIRAAMRNHHFSVPLLTEMDPGQHTTFTGRTLGLNRNKGEVIELRLRTDAYDGYRDYRTIRKTLCHELAHCVYGEHDADFWRLTREIEREVDAGDYWGPEKGRRLTEEEFYNPADWEEMRGGDEIMDRGGWTGGEFVLGGLRQDGGGGGEMSRREILARAAEERLGKGKGNQSDASTDGGTQSGS